MGTEYDNVCRLCLGAGDGGIVPIFCGNVEAIEGRNDLAGEIKACLSIQINEEDAFTKLICNACLVKVKSWSAFKSVCDEAQIKLRNSLRQQSQRDALIDVSFIKEEPYTVEEDNPDKSELNNFEPEITIKSEPQDIEYGSSIQIESITSNYEAPEFLEVVPDIGLKITQKVPQKSLGGPAILASLGLAPKDTIKNKVLRNPVVNLTPLEISDIYPMDTADSMDSGDGSYNYDRYQRRKLFMKMTNCSICGLKFVSSGNARRHEKNVHNFYGPQLHPNPLNPEIIMNNSKSKSVMEPEILMEVDNENIFQSIGENTDDEQYDTLSLSLSSDYEGELTEANIAYIQKYKDVIEQVQGKRCYCCNKTFPKMKLLLSHLRKKNNVPPFQCFNCMISCENRSDYVQHMRLGQCKNLYTVYKKKVAAGEIQPMENYENYLSDTNEERADLQKSDKIPLKDALMCRVFACNYCDLTNRIKAVIKKHLNTEHLAEKNQADIPGQCNYCQKTFEDIESRKRHNQNADCTSHVICELCGEKFDSLPPFNDHASSVHATTVTLRKMVGTYDDSMSQISIQKGTVTCRFCPKVYSTYHNMLRHLTKHHNEGNPPQCEYCKEIFSTNNVLLAHYSNCLARSQEEGNEELQYNFSCKDCGVLFATLDGWTKHQEVHQKCQQCGETFQTQHELELHRKEHLKVKFYNCNICGNSYSKVTQLADHMIEHGIDEKSDGHFCEICQLVFDKLVDYSVHMKEHNIDIPLSSNMENNQVNDNKKNLLVKPNGKTGRNYFRCPICSKHLETKQGLQRHMHFRHKRTHTNMTGYDISKQIFKCDLCPKRYCDSRGVIRHKRTAHGISKQQAELNIESRPESGILNEQNVPPKFCNQCGLSGFHTQNDLNRHRLVAHYPEGAKVCNICNFISKDAKKMWYHKKKYHLIPGSSNQCNICRKLFVTKPQLLAHKKTVHPSINLPMEIEVTAVENIPKLLEYDDNDNDKGPWNCDLCPKIFTSVNALKSHRGWHLRTPNGKSPGNASGKFSHVWLPNQVSPSRVIKKFKFPSSSTPGPSQDPGKYYMSKFKVVPKLPAGAYCRICNKAFSKIAVYKRHVMEFHKPARSRQTMVEISAHDLECIQKLSCSQCNQTFQTKVDWIEHRVLHITRFVKEQGLFEWPCFCGKSFGRKDNLKSHMKTHMHGVVEYHSQNIPTSNITSTTNHASPVNKFYTCNPCRVTFTTEEELKAHTESHNTNSNGAANRVWRCDFCDFKTEDIKLYQECRRAHHLPTKYKCEGCHVYFKSYNILVKHHEDNHKNDGVERPSESKESGCFECNQCGKQYSMKHHLKRHIDSAH